MRVGPVGLAIAVCVLASGAARSAGPLIDIDRAAPPLKTHGSVQALSAADTKLLGQFVTENGALTRKDVQGVADDAALLRIKRYIANLYTGLAVVKTIPVRGRVFYCVPKDEQLSMRDGQAFDTPPGGGAPGASILGYRDKVCPAGTIALAKSDVRSIARFVTLENFLTKHGRHSHRLSRMKSAEAAAQCPPVNTGSTEPPDSQCYVHHHATVDQSVVVTGLKARLNIWNPKVVSPPDMSLMQTWIVEDLPGDIEETLESGWQVDERVDDTLAAPFLYSSQADPMAGCYDIGCVGFVVVTNQIVFAPFAPDRYSVAGGRQGTLAVEWRQKANGNWWLKMNGVWVGYYPAALYRQNGLAAAAPQVFAEFGGENTGNAPAAWMGSGQFAEFGYGRSAFVDGAGYFDASGVFQSLDAPRAPSIYTSEPACYSVDFAPAKPRDAGQGTYFYLGGPGLDDSGCADAMAKGVKP